MQLPFSTLNFAIAMEKSRKEKAAKARIRYYNKCCQRLMKNDPAIVRIVKKKRTVEPVSNP